MVRDWIGLGIRPEGFWVVSKREVYGSSGQVVSGRILRDLVVGDVGVVQDYSGRSEVMVVVEW